MRGALLVLVCGGLAALASRQVPGRPQASGADWLPEPRLLRMACFGHERVFADVLFTRGALTLVHGDEQQQAGAARDLLTAARLDPGNADLYRLGGLLLPLDDALELLRIGRATFPQDGAIPELAGFRIWRERGDSSDGRAEAAGWYALSAACPNHPEFAPRFLERLRAGGDRGTLAVESLVRLIEAEGRRSAPQPELLSALKGLLLDAAPAAK